MLCKTLCNHWKNDKRCNLDNISAFATFCHSVFSRLHKSQLVSLNLDMSIIQKRNSFLLISPKKLSKAKCYRNILELNDLSIKSNGKMRSHVLVSLKGPKYDAWIQKIWNKCAFYYTFRVFTEFNSSFT